MATKTMAQLNSFPRLVALSGRLAIAET